MTTKAAISKKLSKDCGTSLKESSLILEYLILLIKKNSKNKIIKINKFGTFYYKKTVKRIGRNPLTKKEHHIKSFLKLNFKASKRVKDILN
tara:strand:- start:136 stop:408 length:273 start_codon:yes stop_codon:yes gene_type:complete